MSNGKMADNQVVYLPETTNHQADPEVLTAASVGLPVHQESATQMEDNQVHVVPPARVTSA